MTSFHDDTTAADKAERQEEIRALVWATFLVIAGVCAAAVMVWGLA